MISKLKQEMTRSNVPIMANSGEHRKSDIKGVVLITVSDLELESLSQESFAVNKHVCEMKMCVCVCARVCVCVFFMLRADAKVLKTICVCESESFLGSDDGSIRELFRHGRGRGMGGQRCCCKENSSCRRQGFPDKRRCRILT